MLSFVLASGAVPAAAAVRSDAQVGGNQNGGLLPTGEFITPLVAPGSTWQRLRTGLRPDGNADATGAVTTALSPDGKTLLVLTSGYNANFFTTSGAPITTPFLDPTSGRPTSQTTNSFQWVFVYDVSGAFPVQKQHIMLTSAYEGIAWDPNGMRFYVSGGQDDRVYIYTLRGGAFVADPPFVALGHHQDTQNPANYTPQVTGVNVSADGKYLFVANYNNDTVSVVNTATRRVLTDIQMIGASDLGGQFPIWVTAHASRSGATDKIYVSTDRDGVIDVFTTSGGRKAIVVGGRPGKSILSGDGSRLYVVNPNRDEIEQIDTATDTVTRVISVHRPGYRYYGANPNSLALNANGTTLYVTIGGENAIGVIDVASGRLVGRIPTAWYPTSVSISADGTRLLVSNYKSNTGPNPFNNAPLPVEALNTTYRDDYDLANLKAGLASVPIPDGPTLAYLTAIVDANDMFATRHSVSPMMQYLRTRIKHVIFIQKENRTYDQVLGDLHEGNGDPRLTLFPQPLTPNHHALATQFADLDNYYTTGDVSGDGWNWDFLGYSNDINEKGTPLRYAGDGDLQSGIFGGVNVNGAIDVYGNHAVEDTEGTDDLRPGQTGGYLWDAAARAGISYRHYALYLAGPEKVVRHADRVGAIQGQPQYRELAGIHTNPYFYQWDTSIPDEWRYEVWKDQFDQDLRNGTLPQLEFMCIMMDHTGSFNSNVAGLNSPELDVADNDHAVGQIVDAVSHSSAWASTAIFIVEDDSQDGPDHVDSHRSPAFVISPYTRHNSVVHTFYNSVSVVRTMEDLLGLDYLGMYEANEPSMDDVFAMQPDLQPYNLSIPGVLCKPPVDPSLVPDCFNPAMKTRVTPAIAPRHSGQWWSNATKRLSFRHADENDAENFNKILWSGIAGDTAAYPEDRSGTDLSLNRAELLKTVHPPVASSTL